MKKLTVVLLALALALSLAATALAEDPRNITIALWWDIYYDSNDESWEDNEAATGKDTDLMRFDNVKTIEDTYGVTYEFQNLTYAGVQDSVNNSILAGEPDCDVYMVELGWGVPAVMNGYAMDLRDVLDPDDPLLKHEDTVLNYVNLDNGAGLQPADDRGSEPGGSTGPGCARRVDLGQVPGVLHCADQGQ